MSPRVTRQHATGFTLIELMVAISLLAMIALLAWQGLTQTLHGRSRIIASMQDERSLQLAFEQLRQDCAAVATQLAPSQAVVTISGNQLQLLRWIEPPDAPPRLWQIDYRIQAGRLSRSARRWQGPPAPNSTQLWLQGLDSIQAHLYQAGHGWTGLQLIGSQFQNGPQLLRLAVTRPGWPTAISRTYRIGP